MRTILPLLLLALVSLSSIAQELSQPELPGIAGNEEVEEHIRNFQGKGAVGDPASQPLPVEDSLKTFQIADDLKIETVLCEPAVRQPLQISFDERGRMWVVQYLQYPFPAGLKVVKYDQYLRAVFDKVPPPPPHHIRGKDRITIHEDTNGDGTFDSEKVFLEGLNIATSCARGRGGVWVLNPPYLLFYPDENNDDIPDADPVVHLEGFGLEDTHAVANSLCWGPDGWLYGAHGSTVHATVKRFGTEEPGLHFKGQAAWRYHPRSRQFELFAEGGGNTFGLEFDQHGRLFTGHNGGDTRGFHYVQGGYYQKSWGKHGPLTNPHAFGFFPAMKHPGVERFSHTFVIYEGAALPPRYRGKLLAPVPLHHYVALSDLREFGSTFETEDVEKVVKASDSWFRPVDIKVGPEGAVYIADWYDTRLTHVDPRDNWHRESGRIYRLTAKNIEPPKKQVDLSKLNSDGLVDLLSHENKWQRQTALLLLADRNDPSVLPRLKKQLAEEAGQLALELLWAIHVCGGFDHGLAARALHHSNPHVRRWTIRLLGDAQQELPAELAAGLAELASTEPAAEVRSQLASSAKRLPGNNALPILANLAANRENEADPHLPLLIWWGLESKAVSDREEVLNLALNDENWRRPLWKNVLFQRLAQRWAADATKENLLALAKLIDSAPGESERKVLLSGVTEAYAGRQLPRDMPPEFAKVLLSSTDVSSPQYLELRLRAGDEAAHQELLIAIQNDDPAVKAQRIAQIELLGQVGKPAAAEVLLQVAASSRWHSVRRAAFSALRRFSAESIGEKIVEMYSTLPTDQGVRAAAIDTLSSRLAWAKKLLAAVDQERIVRSDVPGEVVQRLALHNDADLNALVKKHWGSIRATPEALKKEMETIAGLLRESSGDLEKGRILFSERCGKCHKLHGGDGNVGPDLTGYERKNLDFLLLSVVDPNAAIREEYTTFRVLTGDGLVLSGFITERGEKTITLQTAEQGAIVLPLEEIEEGPSAVKISLMPERLLADLSHQQVRDLFVFLQSQPH